MKIILLNYGQFDRSLLNKVAESVENEFLSEVIIHDEYVDLSTFFDSTRKQYNGNKLLGFIEDKPRQGDEKLIGLFSVDLFIPILTYIYGQAYLNGKSAIASSHRLSNERYGLVKDDTLFLERLIKETHHELGHCFGLLHCHSPGCVMQSSTYVEDIDQKTGHFCESCRKHMHFSYL